MSEIIGVNDYKYQQEPTWSEIEITGKVSDMATDSSDNVYLAVRTTQAEDDNTGVIVVLDKNGHFVKNIGADKLKTPHHIWISPEDEIYLTDCEDHVVRIYDNAGNLTQVIGTPGQPGMPETPFNMPTCAAQSSSSGDIFVSDGYRQNRIHRINNDGELKLSWGKGDRNQYDWELFGLGTPSTGKGEFNTPHSLTLSDDGRVYVMDRSNHRIQVFNEEGTYLNQWHLPHPNKADIDSEGILHIATWEGIAIFDMEGNALGKWGMESEWKGGHGICVDSNANIYTTGVEMSVHRFSRI